MEEKQKELLATATSPAQRAPTSSVHSHCSISQLCPKGASHHGGNQEFKHKPLKSQLLGTQSANTFYRGSGTGRWMCCQAMH